VDIRELSGMLQGVSGPNASGEYTAKCPAHDDKTASLTFRQKRSEKDGKERIYLKCHANCSGDAVMAALGITPRDLIVDPDGGDDRTRGRNGKTGGGRGAAAGGSGAAGARRGNGSGNSQGNPGTQAGQGLPEGMTVNTAGSRGAAAGGSGAAGARRGNGSGNSQGNPGTQAVQGLPEGMTVNTAGSRGAAAGSHGAGGAETEERPALEIDYQQPDAVYSYTDSDGREVFQVVRYHYKNGPGKTFRQRMRYTEEMQRKYPGLKCSREGFASSVPAEIRDVTLYRMPNVIRAIEAGRPVYVVEGEKDVETMERLGYCATCNPGGAGKWRPGYSRILTGADVIILPDNDTAGNEYTGQNHAWDVAVGLRETAKRVRLVDIREACPELPAKGDISDMVQIMGEVEAMDALARQVAATLDFDPEAVPFWLTPREQAERLYSRVSGYGVSDGCIAQWSSDALKPLCDFVIVPRLEMTRDDGVTTSLYFVLDGWNQSGRKLERVTVPAAALDGMNWVTEKWGMDAALAPGSTVKQKVAWAIKKVGQMTAKKITEYNHTGWRKIGGKWCYLYHGGAIGMEGVTVNMGDSSLKTYRLDGSGADGFGEIPLQDAARMSLRIQKAMKEEIGIALLGTMYLAPLREFMTMTDVVPAFGLYLYGESGTHKSTAAALAMSHFGNFHAKNPPASFNDTANQIRAKAFLVKDAPILVDDFHPTSSVQEKRQMSATAQSLSRAFGDGSDRGRLNADSSIRAVKPPRSVAVITGEDLPAIGASGLARFFILDIDKEDIPIGEELTELQEAARNGYMQKAMRGYIEWLAKQTDELPDMMHKGFLRYREMIRRQGGGTHDRAPEAMACILLGYSMMLRYFVGCGIMTQEEMEQHFVQAVQTLVEAGQKQASDMESEKPSRIFLDAMGELLTSKRVMLKDLSAEKVRDPLPSEVMVGYMDSEYYYLLPNVAFSAVTRLCREQGNEFPVSLKALYKHLRTDGILPRMEGTNATKTKRIDGKPIRLLWIPADRMEGPAADIEQMKMKGFQQVNTDENPF